MSKIHQVSNCVFHLNILCKFNYVSLIIIFGTAQTGRSSCGPQLEEVLIFPFSITLSNWTLVLRWGEEMFSGF